MLLLFLAPSFVRAQPADIVASATADKDKVTLSEPVRVTLTLEGPAPLRVDLPERLLAADADEVWRVRPAVEAAVTPLPGGRARWRKVYRLDAWTPPELLGQPQRVTFNPVKVNGRAVTWPAVAVTVERTGGKTALPEPRPVTAVEDVLPPIDTLPPDVSRAPVVVAVAGVFAGAVVVALVLRSRRAKPVPADAWARAALAEVDVTRGDAAERVAHVLRAFVERRFALPATRLTTAELSAAAGQQGWPVEEADALRALLDQCDLAKFAGTLPTTTGCGAWLPPRGTGWTT